MKTYWDLSEKERAELSRDDVAKFIDAELMTKGVLSVPTLALVPVPETQAPTTTLYQIGDSYSGIDLAFRTEQDARAFAIGAMRIERDWESDSSFVRPITETAVRTVPIAERDAVMAIRPALKAAKVAAEENRKRREAHEAQQREVEKTLESMWADWNACIAKAERMSRIRETAAKYKALAEGDSGIAGRFLLKVFPANNVTEAEDWCSDWPLPIERCAGVEPTGPQLAGGAP
jgi:hypothetical protein